MFYYIRTVSSRETVNERETKSRWNITRRNHHSFARRFLLNEIRVPRGNPCNLKIIEYCVKEREANRNRHLKAKSTEFKFIRSDGEVIVVS